MRIETDRDPIGLDVGISTGQAGDDAVGVAVETTHTDEQRLFVVGDLEHRALRGCGTLEGVALQKVLMCRCLAPDRIIESTVDAWRHNADAPGGGGSRHVSVTEDVGIDGGQQCQ
ncbi:MAG TPA: hypothetical protein EYQ31_03690 [Candidatus Handelsmanbacteria bacterium]|nr:hypothetical protein [Candidatus Handelsmanbacteria bacterium]